MPIEVTENFVRFRVREPEEFDRLRTITLSEEEGIKAIIGFKEGREGSQIQAYLFDIDRWTVAEVERWVAERLDALINEALIGKLGELADAVWTKAFVNSLPNSAFAVVEPAFTKGETENKNARHLPFKNRAGNVDLPHLRAALARMNQIKPFTGSISTSGLRAKARKVLIAAAKKHLKTSRFADSVLFEKLKMASDSRPEKGRRLADSMEPAFVCDEFQDVEGGVLFKNVVFAKEMVQKYDDGLHYKPAKELQDTLKTFRGKPVVAFEHPEGKRISSVKQQVGHIVFDSVFWDDKGNRVVGDVFIEAEDETGKPINRQLLKGMKEGTIEDNSIGFTTTTYDKAGVFKGQKYDKVQRDIYIDHLAVVFRGRASSDDGVGVNAY